MEVMLEEEIINPMQFYDYIPETFKWMSEDFHSEYRPRVGVLYYVYTKVVSEDQTLLLRTDRRDTVVATALSSNRNFVIEKTKALHL